LRINSVLFAPWQRAGAAGRIVPRANCGVACVERGAVANRGAPQVRRCWGETAGAGQDQIVDSESGSPLCTAWVRSMIVSPTGRAPGRRVVAYQTTLQKSWVSSEVIDNSVRRWYNGGVLEQRCPEFFAD
jgi:hypothetical protein